MSLKKNIKKLSDKIERVTYRFSTRYWRKRRISLTQILVRWKCELSNNLIDKRYPDLIRSYSLKLCAGRIYENKVRGSVAELGVYKGEFAKQINDCFPEKKLYLFDTFEGFDQVQFLADKNSHSHVKNDPFQTSVAEVLQKMSIPEQCIVKKGVFPNTAQDVDDQFAFVSLDADLFQPTYDGLKFFYPKLMGGGIFLSTITIILIGLE